MTNPGEGSPSERDKFIANMRIQVPHVIDGAEDIWREYEVVSQPSMVFVSADGQWERRLGYHDPVDLLELATELQAR